MAMQATDASSFEDDNSTIDSGLPAAKRRKTTSQKEPVSTMDIDEDMAHSEEPKASVQTLHGWYNKDGELYWRTTRPQYRRKPDTSKYALILRYLEDKTSNTKALTLYSFTTRSAYLKKVVREVFVDYPGESSSQMEHPEFSPPFWPFFHQWAKLQAMYDMARNTNAEQGAQIRAVIDVLEEEMGGEMQNIKNRAQSGQITFHTLWAVFPSGCPVFRGSGVDRHVFLVNEGKYVVDPRTGISFFHLQLKDLDHDGEKFGWRDTDHVVNHFDGSMSIEDLPASPIHFCADTPSAFEASCRRGTEVTNLISAGTAYRSHKGFSTALGQSRFISGRIITDSQSYCRQSGEEESITVSPGRLQCLMPTAATAGSASATASDLVGGSPITALQNFNAHPVLSKGKWALGAYGDDEVHNTSPELQSHSWTSSVFGIPPEALCRPIVRGYCLTLKCWAMFSTSNISEISWNANAFDALVMPPARKLLLEALVKQQQAFKTDAEVDDVIAGKGQGLILLLPGPPGTGKTLTAESIADRLKIPLYAINASELGDTVAEIEQRFGKVAELAANWNAVLLLDEADAFLEKRTEHPEARERNKRVAAFLRILEYYKGILILTTNRMISFDEAFHSRIHLTMPFKPLDAASRKGIWGNFLHGAPICAVELEEFAKETLNGRQIKNIMKMARLLAKSNNEPLQAGHVRHVLSVAKEDAENLVG